MPYHNTKRRRAAATLIQRFARRKMASNFRKQNFSKKVKRVITSVEPYKYQIQTTLSTAVPATEGPITVSTALTNLLAFSNIPYLSTALPHTRQSTKLLAKMLRLRIKINNNGDQYSRVRLMLVRSLRTNNSNNPASGFENCPNDGNMFRREIVPGQAGTFYPQYGINCFPNQRFVDVLWDHTYQVGDEDGKGTISGNPPSTFTFNNSVGHKSAIHIEKNFKLNKVWKYPALENPDAGEEYAISPWNNQSLFLVAVSGSNATPDPTVYASASLSFKELD